MSSEDKDLRDLTLPLQGPQLRSALSARVAVSRCELPSRRINSPQSCSSISASNSLDLSLASSDRDFLLDDMANCLGENLTDLTLTAEEYDDDEENKEEEEEKNDEDEKEEEEDDPHAGTTDCETQTESIGTKNSSVEEGSSSSLKIRAHIRKFKNEVSEKHKIIVKEILNRFNSLRTPGLRFLASKNQTARTAPVAAITS